MPEPMTPEQTLKAYARSIEYSIQRSIYFLKSYLLHSGTMNDIRQEAYLAICIALPKMKWDRTHREIAGFLMKVVYNRMIFISSQGGLVRVPSGLITRSSKLSR